MLKALADAIEVPRVSLWRRPLSAWHTPTVGWLAPTGALPRVGRLAPTAQGICDGFFLGLATGFQEVEPQRAKQKRMAFMI